MILIEIENIINTINNYNINITGVLHIGAYECEELQFYINNLYLSEDNIIWLEANDNKVIECKDNGIKNIYNYLITNKDNELIKFNISNNILSNDSESSSIFNFKMHLTEHPEVKYTSYIYKYSITIDTFLKNHVINIIKYNFLFIHIQGAELLALQGANNYLKYVNIIYIKINIKELYENNPLIEDIDSFLNKKKFKRILTKITKYGWGDALYIRY